MTDNRFLWEYDEALGFDGLCGIDEVGRGPLAGPVCAACVVLPRGLELPALNDSKKMTEKRREETYALLTGSAALFILLLVLMTLTGNLNRREAEK